MLSICPSLVHRDKLPAIRAVEFSPADLQDWRSAPEIARRKTPEGHVGNPALASATTGAADIEQSAMAMTRAILKRRG